MRTEQDKKILQEYVEKMQVTDENGNLQAQMDINELVNAVNTFIRQMNEGASGISEEVQELGAEESLASYLYANYVSNYQSMSRLEQSNSINLAVGNSLDTLANNKGVFRKQGEKTRVQCKFAVSREFIDGQPNKAYYFDSNMEASSSVNGKIFTLTREFEVRLADFDSQDQDGNAQTAEKLEYTEIFECTESGALQVNPYDVNSCSINQIEFTGNENSQITTGTDKESDDKLRARINKKFLPISPSIEATIRQYTDCNLVLVESNNKKSIACYEPDKGGALMIKVQQPMEDKDLTKAHIPPNDFIIISGKYDIASPSYQETINSNLTNYADSDNLTQDERLLVAQAITDSSPIAQVAVDVQNPILQTHGHVIDLENQEEKCVYAPIPLDVPLILYVQDHSQDEIYFKEVEKMINDKVIEGWFLEHWNDFAESNFNLDIKRRDGNIGQPLQNGTVERFLRQRLDEIEKNYLSINVKFDINGTEEFFAPVGFYFDSDGFIGEDEKGINLRKKLSYIRPKKTDILVKKS